MNSRLCVATIAAALAASSCAADQPETVPVPAPEAAPAPASEPSAPPPSRPNKWLGKTFEEFKATIYKEKFPGGKYIVSGDTPISDEKQLREFFEQKVLKQDGSESDGRLITHSLHGLWANSKKKNLSYCVSNDFGARKKKVAENMKIASRAWEEVADVKFSHLEAHDAACSGSNDAVVFNVVAVHGEPYYARAFFPNEPRADRNLIINNLSFETEPGDATQLDGILRHELGHVLGFRHEQIRLGAGACPNGDEPDLELFVVQTPYDPNSVMHYPDCGGLGDSTFLLTRIDKSGAACNYGPAAGFTINSTDITGRCALPVQAPPDAGAPKPVKLRGQTVAAGEEKPHPHGPFVAEPGTTIVVSMKPAGNSAGDADLYVRLGQKPTLHPGDYNCRPYLEGSVESCELSARNSPRNAVFVMVYGTTAATYDLVVSYVKEKPPSS